MHPTHGARLGSPSLLPAHLSLSLPSTPSPCAGESPLLARVGRLERALLQQAAAADMWAVAREMAEKTAAQALEKAKAAQPQPSGAAAPSSSEAVPPAAQAAGPAVAAAAEAEAAAQQAQAQGASAVAGGDDGDAPMDEAGEEGAGAEVGARVRGRGLPVAAHAPAWPWPAWAVHTPNHPQTRPGLGAAQRPPALHHLASPPVLASAGPR